MFSALLVLVLVTVRPTFILSRPCLAVTSPAPESLGVPDFMPEQKSLADAAGLLCSNNVRSCDSKVTAWAHVATATGFAHFGANASTHEASELANKKSMPTHYEENAATMLNLWPAFVLAVVGWAIWLVASIPTPWRKKKLGGQTGKATCALIAILLVFVFSLPELVRSEKVIEEPTSFEIKDQLALQKIAELEQRLWAAKIENAELVRSFRAERVAFREELAHAKAEAVAQKEELARMKHLVSELRANVETCEGVRNASVRLGCDASKSQAISDDENTLKRRLDDCMNTDGGALDPYNDGCDEYVGNTDWCGGYDDDDFTSNAMCCACGGGRIAPTSSPTNPTPLPTTAVPTASVPPTSSTMPTPAPTSSAAPTVPRVSSFDELKAALATAECSSSYENCEILVSNDIEVAEELVILGNVTIRSAKSEKVVLDAQGQNRIVQVSENAHLIMSGMVLRNGFFAVRTKPPGSTSNM